MAVTLGSTVTDSITGFTGIAISRTEFQYGCVRICVKPALLVEGKMPESEPIDELQLKENDPSTTPKQSNLLGTVDKDVITGISGTIVSRTTYINAGPRLFIQPKGMTDEGKPLEGLVVDEPQLASLQKSTKKRPSSGPGDIAGRHSVASARSINTR